MVQSAKHNASKRGEGAQLTVGVRRRLALADLDAVLAEQVLLHEDQLALPLQTLDCTVERDVHLRVAKVDDERMFLRV